MASVLAESVGWALQPNQTEAGTKLGHRRANPAPPPRLLGSSRLSQKYSLQKQRNMVYKIMEIQWQYLKNTLSSGIAGPRPPLLANESAPVVFDKNIKMANMGWAENDRVLNKDV